MWAITTATERRYLQVKDLGKFRPPLAEKIEPKMSAGREESEI